MSLRISGYGVAAVKFDNSTHVSGPPHGACIAESLSLADRRMSNLFFSRSWSTVETQR
jgi:hypothetical protein